MLGDRLNRSVDVGIYGSVGDNRLSVSSHTVCVHCSTLGTVCNRKLQQAHKGQQRVKDAMASLHPRNVTVCMPCDTCTRKQPERHASSNAVAVESTGVWRHSSAEVTHMQVIGPAGQVPTKSYDKEARAPHWNVKRSLATGESWLAEIVSSWHDWMG